MRTTLSHVTQQAEPPEISMPDPSVALRALRQIRGGADSPIRRLAERAASRRATDDVRAEKLAGLRSERLDYEDDIGGDPDPRTIAEMMFTERSAAAPSDADQFVRDAYRPRQRRTDAPDFDKRPMAEDEYMSESGPRAIDDLPPELQDDAALRSGTADVQAYEGRRKGGDDLETALARLQDVLGGLNTGYSDRPALTASRDFGPSYSAASGAPRFGGMDDDDDEDEDEDERGPTIALRFGR